MFGKSRRGDFGRFMYSAHVYRRNALYKVANIELSSICCGNRLTLLFSTSSFKYYLRFVARCRRIRHIFDILMKKKNHT